MYKRFRNKEALRIAAARQIWAELTDVVVASPRLEDAYRRYLRFCEDYPQEYGVVAAVWSEVFSSEAERPGEFWIRELLSNRYGGRPENYTQAYFAFFF